MKSLGFENDEQIRSFEDPLTWLNYFPPLAVNDLKSIGIHVSIYILLTCIFNKITPINNY